MKIQITLAPLEQPATLFCVLCARNFQSGSVVAQLSAGTWWVYACPACLPNGKDDAPLREAALEYRETLLWLARVMERIAYGTPIESVTRQDLAKANALDEILPKGEREHDGSAIQTVH